MRVWWHSRRPAASETIAAGLELLGYSIERAFAPALPPRGVAAVLLDLPPDLDRALVLVREFRRRMDDWTPLIALGDWHVPADLGPILEAGADDYLPYSCDVDALGCRLAV